MANLLVSNYNGNKVTKHNDFSTTITTSFAKTAAMGVVWKDPDVYFSDTNYTSMKKGTGFSGTVASSFAFGGCVDVDFAGSDLLRVIDSAKVYKHTGFSATISSSFTQGTNNRGVAWDGTNLITGNSAASKIRLHSGFSSTVADSFATGALLKGVTWDGTNIISTQGNTKYFLHQGFSSTITSSIAVETGNTDPYGIDWDGFPSATASGPANLKSYNTNLKANIKSINTNLIANIKSLNTNT